MFKIKLNWEINEELSYNEEFERAHIFAQRFKCQAEEADNDSQFVFVSNTKEDLKKLISEYVENTQRMLKMKLSVSTYFEMIEEVADRGR